MIDTVGTVASSVADLVVLGAVGRGLAEGVAALTAFWRSQRTPVTSGLASAVNG